MKNYDVIDKICRCVFVDKNGDAVEYLRALICHVRGEQIFYELKKITYDLAEGFDDFGVAGKCYFDGNGRVATFLRDC